MVFGLFSRKRAPAPLPENAAASQLRTPPPSVVDKQSSPTRDPPLTPSPPPEAPDASSLRTYIQSIPPQTLHSYVLSRLHPSHPLDPTTLHHVSAFFASLAPPPKLHCVRCHKSYFEIENTDRSCLVAHDDESAEVERVSAKAKGKGTLYETIWNCCGKTVEGDGDMGPPDGWCYEGLHTTDTKRARFRADSTMHDDKLVSCERLRCGMPPRTTRKRGRPIADKGDEDEDEESSVTSSHPSTNASPRSLNSRKKQRIRAPLPDAESNQMDIDTPTPVPAPPPSPHSKPKSQPKPKSRASKPKSTATAAPKPSSPLVPPFISRPSSPDRAQMTGKVQVVPTSASPGPVRSRKESESASASPERTRTRKDSSASTTKKGKAKAKAKALDEVVDSSVDAERATGWVVGHAHAHAV
ncbi:hypothetical protein C0995_002116 [Termitomyces sp. Mi166|nr:hypothetical protein C0995_002116 [Termitomyces sp. Mi166\